MTSTLDAPITTSVALDIDQLGPGFGADVRGVDLATADDATIAAVRQDAQVLLANLVELGE